eukprot:COSAG02_NODE_2063_length_9965_cov_116.411920_4_plen_80_part_00
MQRLVSNISESVIFLMHVEVQGDCMNAQVRNFRAKFRFRAKIGHFAFVHSTGRAKSGHFGTHPRTLWYLAQDTTAPDTL